jgi:hypothetical protein
LRERQVEADGVTGDLIAEGADFLVEFAGLNAADRRVEGRDNVEQPGLGGRVGQAHSRGRAIRALEVGRFVAGFQGRADKREGISFEFYRGGSLLHDVAPLV